MLFFYILLHNFSLNQFRNFSSRMNFACSNNASVYNKLFTYLLKEAFMWHVLFFEKYKGLSLKLND